MRYSFPIYFLDVIMSHIASYGLIVMSLLPAGETYVVETNNPITSDEYSHLNESYNLQEIV